MVSDSSSSGHIIMKRMAMMSLVLWWWEVSGDRSGERWSGGRSDITGSLLHYQLLLLLWTQGVKNGGSPVLAVIVPLVRTCWNSCADQTCIFGGAFPSTTFIWCNAVKTMTIVHIYQWLEIVLLMVFQLLAIHVTTLSPKLVLVFHFKYHVIQIRKIAANSKQTVT